MKMKCPAGKRFCYNEIVKWRLWGRIVLALCLFFLGSRGAAIASDGIDDLFGRLKKSFETKDQTAYLSNFAPSLRPKENAVVSSFLEVWKMEKVTFHRATPGTEKDPQPSLFYQVLFENEYAAMLETWHVVLASADGRWQIQIKEVTGNISNLYKVRIPSGRPERASRVEIRHDDIQITFTDAWIFHDNIPNVETALVVIGNGRLFFSPSDPTEKHQLELTYKKDFLEDSLEYVYLRSSGSFFESNIRIIRSPAASPKVYSEAENNRAYSLFTKYYARSFTIENSLTGELLSFLPQGNQVVFELGAEHLGGLTYINSPFSEEEIHLISQKKGRIINLYSPAREEGEGKQMFISFGQKFDIQSYQMEIDFKPDNFYLSAKARIKILPLLDSVDNLKFNFNPSLSILRIYDQAGRELFYTVDKLRKFLYVYLLQPAEKGKPFAIDVYYRGELEPPVQTTDIVPGGQYNETISLVQPAYESYLYSQSAYWYPAPADNDYFQARLRFSIPPNFLCISNGELTEQGKLDEVRRVSSLDKIGNSLFTFETKYPVKYLSFIVGKLTKVSNGNGDSDKTAVPVQAFISEDIRTQRKSLLDESRALIKHYENWFGPYPYEKLSVVQRLWPTGGGHSPASFVVLNELRRTQETPAYLVNTDSPVDLSRWKEYYIAHEIAHQWWGQAVTGAEYHDQWVSEGLAQFAAIYYLKMKLGDRVFLNILKKFSQWTDKKSIYGPITLGSRLSYLDFMAFQAIVYNKTAVVLNMLREMLGDDLFFQGLRNFYETHKYREARTLSFVNAMERVSGKNLQVFFKGWFQSHTLPEVHTAHFVQKTNDVYILKFRVNQTKDVFVFPLWLEWRENKKIVKEMVVIDEKSEEFEFRTSVKPAKIKINPDKLVPGKFS
jgi:hypothetical protein